MKYISILVLFLISQVVLAQSPFCTPTYDGDPSASLCINKVTLGSYVSHPDTSFENTGGYADHTLIPVNICAGATYEMKVNVNRTVAWLNNPGASAYVMAFFDWNNDGELNGVNEAFHLGEVETNSSPVGVNGPGVPQTAPPIDVTGVINVPSSASDNFYFRVVIFLENVQTTCEKQFIGEVEEFKANFRSYGELDKKNEFMTSFGQESIMLTLDNPIDGVQWQVDNGQGFSDAPSLNGLSTISYQTKKGINALRAFTTDSKCIADSSGQTRSYSSISNFVKLGSDEISAFPTFACQNDSVSTFHEYSNEKKISETTLPTTTTYYTSPDTSLLEVSVNDKVLDFSTLNKVCLNVTSNAFSDLSLILEAPNGKKLILSKRNGSPFSPTLTTSEFCFSDSVGADFINGYSSSFSGTYNPAQSLDVLNGLDPTGTWKLYMTTEYFENASHTLNSWSIEFGHQNFIGWENPNRYDDASNDSARVQVVVDTVFRAAFESEYGNTNLDSVEVFVTPSEDLKLDQLTSDVTNVCPGTSSVFRSTLATGHSNVYYDWYLNGELQEGEHEDTVLISGLNDGDVVKVIADVQNLCNTSKDSLTITVIGQTFQDTELSVNQNKEFPLCENEDLIVAVEIVNGDPNYSSEWLVNNVSVSQNSSTYNWMNVSNNDSLIYHYTQTNACGKVQSFSDTIVFEGIVREDLNTVMNMNDGVVFCQNQNVSFYVDVNDPNISATYTWLLDGDDLNNNTSEFESNSLNVGGHTIDVIYEPNGGCYNQQSSVSTVNFAIDPLRNTELEIGGNVEFCPNDLLVFTIKDSANLGAGALYSWKENGIDLPNETSSSITVLNPVAGNTYALEAISEVNCATPAIVISNELTVVETKLKSLSADFDDAIEAEYCEKSQFVNSAILNGDAILSSAQWYVNGTKQAEGSDIDYELTSGLATIEFVFDYDNGCGVIETGSISETFEVFAPADTVFQVLQNSTEYAVQLTNTFNEANTSYQWLLNGEFLSNDAEPVFELINEGSYTLCMSTNRGDSKICPSEKCLEFIYIGIDDADFSNTIELFPNPATNQLNVSGVVASEVEYKILNAQGQTVLEGRLKMEEKGIELNQLQSGAYQIVIVANKKVGIKRFVKM